MPPVPENLKDWLEVVAYGLGIAAAVGSAIQYRRNSVQERTRWLFELYQHFYERAELKEMRKRIDSGETQFAVVKPDHGLQEKLDDYLNFFEFLAGLRKRKAISRQEIVDMFDYPLRRIAEDSGVSPYVAKPEHGYEGLRELLDNLGYSKVNK